MTAYSRFVALMILGILGCSSLVAFAQTGDECLSIARNLRVGMKGPDVAALQRILNGHPLTSVALSGPGSSGYETAYYGTLTKNAVQKFQDLYASEVLTPVGLTKGSGYFGPFTRVKVFKICASLQKPGIVLNTNSRPTPPPSQMPAPTVSQTVTPTLTPRYASTTTIRAIPDISPTSPTEPPPQGDVMNAFLTQPAPLDTKGGPPVLSYISSYVAYEGSNITISGAGFSGSATVHIGNSFTMTGTSSVLGGIVITIPPNAPRGKSDLWVTTTSGDSNKSFIIIAEPTAIPPTVTSIFPTSGFDGTTVTIKGTGFTPTNNTIHGGQEDIVGLTSSDGTTLQFVASLNIPGVAPGQDVAGIDVTVPYWFTVMNANGITASAQFNIKY